ncbi:MAG: CBS domain-containing protein [Dethiobacter sp.]|jgi:tRNA nucleotidyltransferase (CCA-adding enzyme)|nr:CBS domain-containing protein [Dethiobacter sp.]
MQVITTHQNADFDALASMVAAGKIYPHAHLVYSGSMNRNVHEFVALYKDALNIKSPKYMDLSAVGTLIITDTKQKSRLGALDKLVDTVPEIHIFDHHPDTEEDISATELCCEEVGATTTLLLEKIAASNIQLSTLECSLFILGIYEDTGCLTYASTTARDAAAVYRLWQTGVNLRVVNQFLNRPLSGEQRSILEELLTSTEYHELRGVRVAITFADSVDYVDGLALLTHRLIEIEDVDVVFSVVSMEDRIYIVGRSRLDHFNLLRALAAFNGKGHPLAASATVKGVSLTEVREKLVSCLYREILPVPTAREIMSSPVRTVESGTSVDKARELMIRYGHTGFPVLDGEKLVGIISRRDLEKASHHGLGHAPVRGYMNKTPLTAPPDLPVRKIQQLMMEHNVGRFPITDGDSIVGIVTRTDVLRNLEGGQRISCSGGGCLPAAGDNLTPLINSFLPRKLQSLLLLVGQTADREDVRVYAVGGFVRDLLLRIPNHDLDLVVEHEAIPFARKLNELLRGQLKEHEQFGTASIELPDGSNIDLVTSRQEFYSHPAALPEVEQSNLKNDLFRRDFTINTLACSLNIQHFGLLHDFFHGVGDLEKGLIRVLYNLSFVEDPLRVLRAIRFEQRFQFKIEETTLSLVENAAQTRVLEKVSKERLYEEITLALAEEKAPEILARYFELGLGETFFPGIRPTQSLIKRLYAAREMRQWSLCNWKDAEPMPSVLYLAAVLYDLSYQEARHSCRRLRLSREEREKVLTVLESVPRLLTLFLSREEPSQSGIYRALASQPVETLLFLQIQSGDSRIWKKTSLYWEKLRHQQTLVNGNDLVELGYKPGPHFQQVLRAVHEARLNGEITNREEELALVNKLFAALTATQKELSANADK